MPFAAKIGATDFSIFSVVMVMQSTGQTFSHCLQPIQSSIFTWRRIRERSLRSPSGTMLDFQRSSGFSSATYCCIALGIRMWRKVIVMPFKVVIDGVPDIDEILFHRAAPQLTREAQGRGGDQHRECDRDEVFPAKRHQLVDPQAGQRPPKPHLHENESKRLEKKRRAGPQKNGPTQPPRKRMTVSPATKNMAPYSARKNKREAHAAVLGVEAGDELGLRLGDVERVAVGLGEAADEENDESDDVQTVHPKDEPVCELPEAAAAAPR